MYLKRLELHGFKSFADRTVVDFSEGITVVVGPNGCGKSNIVDAVRWVIGEQRARILRSEKMENVIFNGTSGRRSLGMSEVLLTIENTRGILPTEYSEVTIGRRLFRSGESEYLLNGTQCRLKDITDLFMDTGMGAGAYSVIELKMIEDILSENAQDRRHMFEEAAGISKYKIRRAQTMRKLGGTQVDLNRVRDLVEELEKRVRSLQRQARNASRFNKLEERLNHLALSLAYVEYGRYTDEEADLKRSLSAVADQVSGFTSTLTAREADHEALQKDHVGHEQIVVSAQTELSNHTDMLRSAESDLRLNIERKDVVKRDLARASEEKKAAEIRRAGLNEFLNRTTTKMTSAEPEAEEAASSLEAARHRREQADHLLKDKREFVQSLTRKEKAAQAELVERSRRIDRLASRIEVLDHDIDENGPQLADIETSIDDLNAVFDSLCTDLAAKQKVSDQASESLDIARQEREKRTRLLAVAESNLRSEESRHAAASAEVNLLESLLSSFDEFSEPLQFLAETNDWSDTGLTTVSDILGCNDEHRIALDAALGEYSACVVVHSEAEAERAIDRLRTDQKGRATFLILDRIRDLTEAPAAGDAVPLVSLVRTQSPEHERLAALLLSDCYLIDCVDGIDPDRRGRGRYFTASGEWFDAAGFWHGGSAATGATPAASRLGRREQLERALISKSELERSVKQKLSNVEEARSALQNLPMEDLESSAGSADEARRDAEKHHSRTAYEREILGKRRDEIRARQAMIERAREEARTDLEETESGLADLREEASELGARRTAAEESFSSIEAENRAAFELFNEANIIAVQAHNRLSNLQKDRKRTIEDLTALEKESRDRDGRMESLDIQSDETETNATALEAEIRKLKDHRGELDQSVNKARNVLMDTKVAISDLEASLRELRRQREEAIAEESRQSVRQAGIITRLQDLIETMAEDYEVDLTTLVIEVETDFSEKEAREEIRDLRNRIRNLGPVNALALESFEEEKARLEFLHEQLSDLEHAEATLLETIGEINQTASERFTEIFNAIQINFQRLFTELFGEDAKADIVLMEPDNQLESTIEILARPRGKKPSVLAQLSGGEKTLTAIALLFAIYLVKPSPFCILDEVDAPLDDANVDRFMHLIRSFSDSTQFILVTHNKRTMEAADRMYGITMEEQGVSKMVGVKFDAELQLVA